jgi:Type II secretion system (T2SS), protein G
MSIASNPSPSPGRRFTPKKWELGLAAAVIGTACIFALLSMQPSEVGVPGSVAFAAQPLRMREFADLCKRYKKRIGLWPTNTVMIAYVLGVTNQTNFCDVWGRPYALFPSTSGSGLLIVCYGADGKPGGSGEDADCTMTLK